MPKLTFEVGLAIFGTVLTVLLLVLDKADKLKGPILYLLLVLAALMTLPLALGTPAVTSVSNEWRVWARSFAVVIVILVYWAIGIWIAPNHRDADIPESKSLPTVPTTGSASPTDKPATVDRANAIPIAPNPTGPQISADTQNATDPLGHLAQLGWGVKSMKDGLTFEIANKSLPNMKESARYFKSLHKPFHIQLQQVSGIAGIKFLSGIESFRDLGISASDIIDFSELSGLTSLRTLNISQTPFTVRADLDISPLASLVNSNTLGLNMSRVTDLGPVHGLRNLVSLNLGGTLVRDLAPISGLNLLRTLDVRDSGVTDLSVLKSDPSLEELTIDAKQAQTIDHRETLVTLRVISQVPVDLAAVGTLAQLKSLFIWGPPVVDLSPLRKTARIKELAISGTFIRARTQVNDVDAIGQLKGLKTLSLSDLELSSLNFLAGCSGLTELNLGNMPLTSAPELGNLVSLSSLSLASVPLVDISPLLSLTNLKKLTLVRTPARADVISELEKQGVKVTNN